METRPGGYVLEVDHTDIDAYRFEQGLISAVAESDPTRRLALLDEAFTLWRGSPLGEFTRAGWADREATRLAALHVQASPRRADALLELDRVRDAVAELEGLASTHPVDETFCRQLMLAL